MRKILSTIALTTLAILPLQADLQMTLMDKDGVEIKQCIKSYSFSNNLESLAKQKGLAQDVYSEEETLTNKVYLGKPVYRKILNFTFDASSANATNPLQVDIPIINAEKLFIINSEVTSGTVHSAPLVQIKSNTYWWIRGINNIVQFRTYSNTATAANAVVEYTKTTDVANTSSNTFKSYIHYIPSSSTTDDVITKDLENKGVIFDKNYTYDSSTDSCTKN